MAAGVDERPTSRQAEAERERRARVIAADGEFQASKKLSPAAEAKAAAPSILQLRLLQTVVDVDAEQNSTLVMPFPVELLGFFERLPGSRARPRAPSRLLASPMATVPYRFGRRRLRPPGEKAELEVVAGPVRV